MKYSLPAFHIFSGRQGRVCRFYDFEIFTIALSALEWKKHNGPIRLVTSRVGWEYFHTLGLDVVYDDIQSNLDELLPSSINTETFWAGCKIAALASQNVPCVMMDLDFIVWRHWQTETFANELAVIHQEPVNNDIYPQKEFFQLTNWHWPELDWSIPASNTAFAYFGNIKLKDRYTKLSLNFMESAGNKGDNLSYMVFAEQRLLSMVAAEQHVPIHVIAPLHDLFGEQSNFTHVWGQKEALRQNPQCEHNFCLQAIHRLKYDFPDWVRYWRQYSWMQRHNNV